MPKEKTSGIDFFSKKETWYKNRDIEKYIYDKTINNGVSVRNEHTFDLSFMNTTYAIMYKDCSYPMTCCLNLIPNVYDNEISILANNNKLFHWSKNNCDVVYDYLKKTDINKYPFVIFNDDTKEVYLTQYTINNENAMNKIIEFVKEMTNHITKFDMELKNLRFKKKIKYGKKT